MERYRAFQKVVECGSFTRAAKELGYSQSSISQMMASLENELGFKLLTRSRSGAKLTVEGAEIFPYVERALYQYRALTDKAAEMRGLETGVVRVGTISSVTCHWMPPLIQGFEEHYTHVKLVFHQGDYTLIPEWIDAGRIDFGFINPAAATNLVTREVKSGEMLAIVPKDHPLARQSSVSLADLATEPFILLEEGQYSEPMAAFEKAHLAPNIRYTLHDDYAIMRMVESGLGVGILAKLVLLRTNYDIACIPIDPPVMRTLSVAYKSWDTLPIASKRFITYLLDHREDLP